MEKKRQSKNLKKQMIHYIIPLGNPNSYLGLIHPVMNFVGNVGYVAVAILRRLSCY